MEAKVRSLAIVIFLGIIIILIILSSFDEDSPIMRAFGFLNMILFLASPFVLYSILSKNKTD
ncbi:uncharacterized protein METZ01_LOCUS345969 [marine metagenome]|uniref:Uncharacterized protein n=1 Tax=marine metagenome TaxID=408172 RepID=A0A382R7F6_9ZZZZ